MIRIFEWACGWMRQIRIFGNWSFVAFPICDPFAHLLTSDLVNLRRNGRTTDGSVRPTPLPLSLFLCACRPPTHRSVAPYKAARGSLHLDQSRPFRSPSHWDRRGKRRSSRKAGSKTEVKPTEWILQMHHYLLFYSHSEQEQEIPITWPKERVG